MPWRGRGRCDDPEADGPPHEPRETELAESVQPITRVDPLPRGVGRRLLLILVGAAVIVLLIVTLFDNMREFFEIILLSLFLSFAIEPAVNWLARHGWKRGLATGAVFL